MAKVLKFVSRSNKTASGFDLADLERGFKKFRKKIIDTDKLKAIWNEFSKLGRSALDAIAAANGVPIGQLRQQFRNSGIDPDKFDQQLTELWSINDLSSMADQELDATATEAENNSKLDFGLVGLAVMGLAALVLFTGILRRR